MALTDAERNPPVIENGRVPIRVDPDRELLEAEDAAIHEMQHPTPIDTSSTDKLRELATAWQNDATTTNEPS